MSESHIHFDVSSVRSDTCYNSWTERDKKWAGVATRRLQEIRSGRVQPVVPGKEVLRKIQERFQR